MFEGVRSAAKRFGCRARASHSTNAESGHSKFFFTYLDDDRETSRHFAPRRSLGPKTRNRP